MALLKANFYIDGFSLYYGCVKDSQYKGPPQPRDGAARTARCGQGVPGQDAVRRREGLGVVR